MPTIIGLLSGLYFVLIIGGVGFLFYMMFRIVKALEKIADTYSKK
ncbi:MAG: hypothetical protein AB1521_09525 [Bacteroidota bacterium]